MVNNVQYHCCESLGIDPVSTLISNEILESNICKALSLTDHEVKPNNFQTCHHLKKEDYNY